MLLAFGGVLCLVAGCSNKRVMEESEARFIDINEEFSKVVNVSPAEEKGKTVTQDGKILEDKLQTVESKKKTKKMPRKVKMSKVNRRPVQDPFREGEQVVLAVKYFKAQAGNLAISVDPFKYVNGKKAYAFSVSVKTSNFFSRFYAVDNRAETFVDYEELKPLAYSSESKESAQHKEVRVFFDWQQNRVTHWEKTVRKDRAEEKKQYVWSMNDFAQDIISSVFYLRTFTLSPGLTFSFHVADAGKNYTFKGEVLRRETLSTKLGNLDTLVVRPTFTLEDKFAPTGENLIWVTNDDRKFIVRIESKIKIGTLVATLDNISKGSEEN